MLAFVGTGLRHKPEHPLVYEVFHIAESVRVPKYFPKYQFKALPLKARLSMPFKSF